MKRYLPFLIPLICALVFAVFAFQTLTGPQTRELLIEAQEQSYWQPGWTYFDEACQQPGGIFSWAGRYFTQYLIQPSLGASLLIFFWLITYVLLVWGVRLRWWLSWLALVPVSLLLWSETVVGYYVYVLKVPDWWFAPTLFVTAVALVMALCRWFPRAVRWSLQALMLIVALFIGDRWLDAAKVPDVLRPPFQTSLTDDANLYTQMRIERAAEATQWDKVLDEVRHVKGQPNREIWIFKNIALLNQDRLLEDWLNYPCMTQLPNDYENNHILLVEQGGIQLYFLHGCMQFAYRWCMENMVEYGPSVKRMRYMTLCALATGELDVARKYLDLLSRTRNYKAWADEHRKFLVHPEAMRQDPRYSRALLLADGRNSLLDTDNGYGEKYLIHEFSTMQSAVTVPTASLSLMYAMQTQDIATFWSNFFIYANLMQGQPMPVSCQEAAFLYGTFEPGNVDISAFPFDAKVPETFQRFMAASQQYGQQGMNEQAMGRAMYREFGHTFFWFYYFCRNQKIY